MEYLKDEPRRKKALYQQTILQQVCDKLCTIQVGDRMSSLCNPKILENLLKHKGTGPEQWMQKKKRRKIQSCEKSRSLKKWCVISRETSEEHRRRVNDIYDYFCIDISTINLLIVQVTTDPQLSMSVTHVKYDLKK